MRMLLPSDSLSGKTGLLVRKIWLGSRHAWESLGVRARSVLLVFLTVVAVTGLAFAVADRAIHGMLFPQENGNEEERKFLDMAAFMLGGSVSVILVMALFVLTSHDRSNALPRSCSILIVRATILASLVSIRPPSCPLRPRTGTKLASLPPP